MGELRTITYKGRTIRTSIYKEMSDELFEKLKEQFYKKPSKGKVYQELHNILCENGTKMSNIKD